MSILNWRVMQARVNAFPAQPLRNNDRQWWVQVVAKPCTQKSYRPAEDALVVAGQLGKATLTLAIEPFHVNWQLDALDEAAPSEVISIPELGPYPESTVDFSSLITNWLALAPPIL